MLDFDIDHDWEFTDPKIRTSIFLRTGDPTTPPKLIILVPEGEQKTRTHPHKYQKLKFKKDFSSLSEVIQEGVLCEKQLYDAPFDGRGSK